VGSEHVGNIRLSDIRWRHYRAQVALLIGSRAHWGQGIATRAIGTVSAHALGPMGLNKLEAGILIGNVASRRAFEKSGYEVEGRLRAHAFFEGAFCDTLLMSRFRERPSGE
jgi:RimJ/RimL family protein N-acetyltransferase